MESQPDMNNFELPTGEVDAVETTGVASEPAPNVEVPGGFSPPGFITFDPPSLTLPEKEAATVRLIALGRTHKSIAEEFGVTPAAIDQRRRRAMNRLGVTTAAGLVHYAIMAGLCNLGEAL